MTDPQHEETFADTERKLREIITTLRAQLAEVQRLMRLERTIADKNADKADRAEAALAAQIEADAGIADHYADQDYCAMGYPEEGGIAASGTADMIRREIRAQPHDRTALDRMLTEAKAEALQGPWSDKPDDLTDAVHKAHPVFTKKYDTYTCALELVSNRHSKGALVALVNYLLRQSDEAREKALRDAATEAERTGTCLLPSGHFLSERCRDAILALIEAKP